MTGRSPTPCPNCLLQNGSLTHPVFENAVISDGHVMSFVMMLGLVMVFCSLAVNGLSHRAMATGQRRGAGLLRQLIGLGDLLGGAVIFLLLLYTYLPVYYSNNTQPTGSCCVNFKSPDLVVVSRTPLTLLLVAFARHIHINLVFMQNWKDTTIGSTFKIFLPAIIGISIEFAHMVFAAVYPEIAHGMISSLPWPSICVWSKTVQTFDGAIIGLPCFGITMILLVYVVLDFKGAFRRSSVSSLSYTEVVKGLDMPSIVTQEINSNVKSCDEKSKDSLLLGSDYSNGVVSTQNLVDTEDVVLPISNIQVKHPVADDKFPPVRTSVMVSLNAFVLVIPLILSMTILPFDDGSRSNCLTFILMLLRWTFLSVCNVFTCLYYIFITAKN